jgi:predicted transcriptional regulator of viral defense system
MNRGRKPSPNQEKAFKSLARLGVFGLKEALKAGIPHATFLRRVAANDIERVGPGLYRHPESKLKGAELDYAIACARFGPKAAIGGFTALQHYNLIEQVPQQICVLVPPEKQARDPYYSLIRTTHPFNVGIEDHGDYRITTVDRTLAEALRYATKIGLKTAIQACRVAVQKKLSNERKILRAARELGIEGYVIRHWEAITP